MKYYRYELTLNDTLTGYGYLIGASIFGLVPEHAKTEYNAFLNVLPNPQFDEVHGMQCISYFKDEPTSNKLAECFLAVINEGCLSKSTEDFRLGITKVELDTVANIVYEDTFQVVSLIEGTTVYRDYLLDENKNFSEVQLQILYDVTSRILFDES